MKRDDSQFEWRQLAAEWRAKHTPTEDLESRLIGEFRKMNAARASRNRATNMRMFWLATAAVMVLIAGASLWNYRQPQKPIVALVQPLRFEPTVAIKAPQPVKSLVAARAVPAKKRMPRRRTEPSAGEVIPVSNASAQEVYTEFFPLEEGPTSIDRGSVVRVRVPRSAMFRVGLPVNMNRLNDSIQADLVFSEEGIAKAVRFVQ